MKLMSKKLLVSIFVLLTVAALAMPAATSVAAQIARGAARPKVDRPDGPVWLVIRKNCTMCHGIDDYAFYSLDRAGWKSLLETKHKSPLAEGTPVLAEKDQIVLLDWLVEKFGPKTKPFPRSYVPPEITEFFNDGEATFVLNRSCTSCHSLDRVMQARNSPDQWRVISVDMRERGAKLTDEELERLVEWLGRVKGINPNQ
jgi:cytochrome c553